MTNILLLILQTLDIPISTVNVWLLKIVFQSLQDYLINQKIKDLKKVLEKVDIDKWIEIRLKYLKFNLKNHQKL